MSNLATTITVLAGIAGLLALQTLWIIRALSGIDSRLDRIDGHLGELATVLRDHGERIARLEART